MALFLILIIAAFPGSSASSAPSTISSGVTAIRDSAIVIGNGSPGPFWISGYFIIAETDSVYRYGGGPLERAQYSLDVNSGHILLNRILSEDDTICVHFHRLAFSIPTEWTTEGLAETRPVPRTLKSYAIPTSAIGNSPGVERTGQTFTENPSARAQSIQWQGFKSFSVTTSSGKSADWSQGLELSVAGEIAEGMALRAAVSDRFSNTQSNRSSGVVTRVGDLDRFFIEAESPQFFGRFGQVSLPRAGQFGAVRQATGARLSWDTDAHEVSGYLGRATGTSVRRRLATQPQIAGPYRLSGEGSRGDVLPSSVVVLRDGSRLVEGTDADFTFDIATGSITFGPSAIPDASTVVLVEYERVLDEYRRTLAGSSWNWSTRESRLNHRFALNWEADDPNQPLFGELSVAQRSELSASSDGSVEVPAYQYYGTDDGDYDLHVLNTSDSVFAYVGPGNGEWRVGFEHVGAGQGRYRHLAEDAFEYVGPGGGSYEPITTLGAPGSFMTLSETARITRTPLGSFEASWFGFANDPNRFAANTTQLQSNHHAGWSLQSDRTPHTSNNIYLDWWRTESVAERSRSVDSFSRFASAWQLRESFFDDSRSEYQAGIASDSAHRVSITAEAGAITSNSVDALRWNLGSELRALPNITATASWVHRMGSISGLSSRAQDSRRELRSALQYDIGGVTLRTNWQQHDLDNDHRVFEDQPSYAAIKAISASYSEAKLQYQWSDAFDSVLQRRRTRELSLSTPLDVLPDLQGTVVAARGEQSLGSDGFTPYYRGRLDGVWQPLSDAVIHAEMDLSYTQSGVEQEVYLPTRPGQGQYRLERGEYVPDVHGDFRRVVSRSDEVGSASYDGRQMLSLTWNRTIGGWRWRLASRRDRIARHDPNGFRPQLWLAPWTPYTWSLAEGARGERHDFYRLSTRPSNQTEFSFDWTSDRTVFGLDRLHNNRDRFGVAVRQDLNAVIYLEGSAEYENLDRRGASSSIVDATASTLRLTVGGTPRTRIQWSLEGRRRIDDNHSSLAGIRLLGIQPRIQANWNAVSILLESDLTWVQPQHTDGTISSLLAEGRPEGFSMIEFCEVRWQLPSRVTLKSRLHADLREMGADRWRWDIQTVARF